MELKEENIAEQWHVLLAGCQQEEPGLLALVEENLEAAAVPGMSWSQESVAAGVFRSLLGRRRDALVVRYRPFSEWRVVLFAHPFGENLQVSWFVVVTPKRTRDILRALRFTEEPAARQLVGSELSLFDRQRLAAFVAVTDDAAKAAVTALGVDQKLSPDPLGLAGVRRSAP